MAQAPRPGTTKPLLEPLLGREGCTRLPRAFIERVGRAGGHVADSALAARCRPELRLAALRARPRGARRRRRAARRPVRASRHPGGARRMSQELCPRCGRTDTVVAGRCPECGWL